MKKPNITKILDGMDWESIELVRALKLRLDQAAPAMRYTMRDIGKELLTDIIRAKKGVTEISTGLLTASRSTEDGTYSLSFIPFVSTVYLDEEA